MNDRKEKCIYCFREKPIEEFSEEHIFPDALGGNLCGDKFETKRVCKKCNSLSGLFIDGIFLRSWFGQNYSFESALCYLDWENGSPLPLMFMGIFEEFCSENEICEYWSGPCGEHIYYFHEKDDTRYDSYAKGDPIKRQRKDTGYAIIFGTSLQPNWNKIGLFSFKKQFKKAKRYSGNYHLNKEGHDYFFHNPTPEIEKLINSLKEVTNEEHKLRSVHKLDMEDRFLCKIALGFGFKFLGDDFLNSNYAMELQKALWEKDPCKRKQYKIRGTGFMHETNIVDDILQWEGGHVLLFKVDDGKLSLALSIFGKFGGYILISDESALLKNMELPIEEEGSVFIIIPQREICIGPISLPSYISHKVGNIKIEQLSEIESLKIDISKLPPCQ